MLFTVGLWCLLRHYLTSCYALVRVVPPSMLLGLVDSVFAIPRRCCCCAVCYRQPNCGDCCDLSPPSYFCFSVHAARILRCCVLSLRLLQGAYASVHGLAVIIVAPAVYLCVLHGFFTVCISRFYMRRSMHLLSHELAVLPRLPC